MAEHNAPFSHIAYQHPDGTTGVLDNHDAEAIHDGTATVKAQNLEDGSVTNGKLAPKSVTEAELADGSVTAAVIADGAVAKEKLSPEMQESWDSLSQRTKIAYEDVNLAINPVADLHANGQPNVKILQPKNVNQGNFLGRQLIKVWPRSTWIANGAQAMVAMSYGAIDSCPFNQACFTSNYSQVYDLKIRFWYLAS